MQKLLTYFFFKNISIYAIFNDQTFNDTLTNDIVSFEQLGPDLCEMYTSPREITLDMKIIAHFMLEVLLTHLSQENPKRVISIQ